MIEDGKQQGNLSAKNIKQIIHHCQIPSSNPKNKIHTVYNYSESEISCYKLLLLRQQQFLYLDSLCMVRVEIFKAINKVNKSQDQLSTQNFSEKLTFQKQVKEQSNEILLRIKQPFYKGKNLDECIKYDNLLPSSQINRNKYRSDGQTINDKFSSVKLLIVNLINQFIRIDKEGRIIPTFQTIMFDPLSKNININLFSFVGVNVLQGGQAIELNSLKEILPFLGANMFEDQQDWINLPKALAIIVLGVILGKVINLFTSKDKIPKTKEDLRELVKRNSSKFLKILKFQRLNKEIAEFENIENIKLSVFLREALVQEKQLSWAQCLCYLFNKDTVVTNKVQNKEQNQLKKFQEIIKKFAQCKWKEISNQDRQYFINNRLVSIVSPSQMLSKQFDCQIFVIVLLEIDCNLLKDHFKFSQFLYQIQGKGQKFCFNSAVMKQLSSFIAKILEKPNIFQNQSQPIILNPPNKIIQIQNQTSGQKQSIAQTLASQDLDQINQSKIQIQGFKDNNQDIYRENIDNLDIKSTVTVNSTTQNQAQGQSSQDNSLIIQYGKAENQGKKGTVALSQISQNREESQNTQISGQPSIRESSQKSKFQQQGKNYRYQSGSLQVDHDQSIDMILDDAQSPFFRQDQKRNWLIKNLSGIYFQPQIHKFKIKSTSYKVESNRLKALRQYQKCFVE